jgi:methyl-accepting chemotaxis protein
MAGSSLSDIALSVSTISDMNIQIAAASEEQTAVTEDLTRNVMTISDATGHVTEAATESEKTSERISEISISIRDKVKRFIV